MMISAMTGGSRRAKEYNRMLARAAGEFGIGLGIGSQRAGLEKPEHLGSYTVVREFEVPLLMANIGAPQLTEKGCRIGEDPLEHARSMISDSLEMIGAEVACVHFNYLQEMVQTEGETFVGGLKDILKVLAKEFPLVAKETGAGMSRWSAAALKDMGFKGVDVGGRSGTSFSKVEALRDVSVAGIARRKGSTFGEWGIPTPVSILESRVGLPVIATGGLRNGLDLAKALALGADCGGMARTLLLAASGGYESLQSELSSIMDELRSAVFLSGADSIDGMRDAIVVPLGDTARMIDHLGHSKYLADRISAKSI